MVSFTWPDTTMKEVAKRKRFAWKQKSGRYSRNYMKPTSYIDSINCAIEGILHAAKTQKHIRNHFLAALVILVAVLFLRVSALEFTLLAISVSFVLFAEL